MRAVNGDVRTRRLYRTYALLCVNDWGNTRWVDEKTIDWGFLRGGDPFLQLLDLQLQPLLVHFSPPSQFSDIKRIPWNLAELNTQTQKFKLGQRQDVPTLKWDIPSKKGGGVHEGVDPVNGTWKMGVRANFSGRGTLGACGWSIIQKHVLSFATPCPELREGLGGLITLGASGFGPPPQFEAE